VILLSGKTVLSKKTISFLPQNVVLQKLTCLCGPCSRRVHHLSRAAFGSIKNTITSSFKVRTGRAYIRTPASRRTVYVYITLHTNEDRITLDTDESYYLSLKSNGNTVTVNIKAKTFFGARHAMETFSQLSTYYARDNSLQILDQVEISDKPAYPYRGVLLDTSRNWFSVQFIRKLIKSMSFSKLNTFHWHMTDTHSFPMQIKSVPQLSKYGAYSPRHVYTANEVKSIVNFATFYGVRVLPEFDQPAHVGEGWQFGEKEGLGKLAVCVNREPWQDFCLEPPCGQLNPTNDNIYGVLKKVYTELFDMFKPDLFHAGGDEINFNCWNKTQEIVDFVMKQYGGRESEQYFRLWERFLKVRLLFYLFLVNEIS